MTSSLTSLTIQTVLVSRFVADNEIGFIESRCGKLPHHFFSPCIDWGSLDGERLVMASRFPFKLIGPRALPQRLSVATLIVLITSLVLLVSACIREEDITLEQRAHQLSGELMCLVCDGQTIDGSSAQIAIDMRLKVRELLEEGNTNAEIREYFVVRYGEEILAAPSGSGFNLLALIVPVVIVVGAIGIALFTIKNMRDSSLKKQTAAGTSEAVSEYESDLDDYLAKVDRDLGISDDRSYSTDTSNKENL